MPRESTTVLESASPTARKRLEDLLDLVARTPGWRVTRTKDGWYVVGGAKPVVVPSSPPVDTMDEEIARLEAALAREGWSRRAAEEHIAKLDAMYGQFDTKGYPKQDRVLTRADCRQMLEFMQTCGCNTRPPRRSAIDRYRKAMDAGRWRPYSPQGLILSQEHGCVIDGSQRLRALLESGLGQMGFSITYDVPIKEFLYFDQGANRSNSDLLAHEGFSPTVRSKLGAIVQLLNGYDRGGLYWKTWRQVALTPPEVTYELISDDEHVGRYVAVAGKPYNDSLTLMYDRRNTSTGCKMLPAVGGAVSFLVLRDYPNALEPWEEFRTALVYGENLPRGDARGILRNQLMNRDMKKPHRNEIYHQLGMTLLAWERWRNDQPGLALSFRDNQTKMPRVWVPGMPLQGADAKRKARERSERFALSGADSTADGQE